MANHRRTVVVVSDHALFREGVTAVLRDHGYQVIADGPAASRRADVLVVDLDHARDDIRVVVRQQRQHGARSRLIAVGTPLRLAAAGDETADVQLETARAEPAALVEAIAAKPPRPSAELARAHRLWSRVTPRQRDVLRWLAFGHDNPAIALHLGIGERAVKAHVSSLLDLFGCQSRTQLAILAYRAGMRPPSG